jgi:hypothetical protein
MLILMAYDVFWMKQMDDRPATRFSRVGISLHGRRGFMDYDDAELDEDFEIYADDMMLLAATTDELVAWAQETSGVQFVDLEKRTWVYRPGMVGSNGPDAPRVDGSAARPRGIFGELVDELEGIRDESSEEPGFIYVNGRIDVKLLGREE